MGFNIQWVLETKTETAFVTRMLRAYCIQFETPNLKSLQLLQVNWMTIGYVTLDKINPFKRHYRLWYTEINPFYYIINNTGVTNLDKFDQQYIQRLVELIRSCRPYKWYRTRIHISLIEQRIDLFEFHFLLFRGKHFLLALDQYYDRVRDTLLTTQSIPWNVKREKFLSLNICMYVYIVNMFFLFFEYIVGRKSSKR
jgi:hypothetical protein